MDKIHAFKVHDGHVDPPYRISMFDEKITCPHCRKLKGLPQLEKPKSMYISNLLIENFRIFGCGDKRLVLEINPGLTALIGENDEGKSAIIDAIRFILGTNDHNYTRIEDSDFHWYESDEEGVEDLHSSRSECRCDFVLHDSALRGDDGAALGIDSDCAAHGRQ